MSDGRFYWLKMKRDFFRRHDIRIIHGMENGRDIVLFYIELMIESVDHEGTLRFNKSKPYTNGMLASLTGTPQDIVEQAMNTLIDFGLVEIAEDKTIILPKVIEMIDSASDTDSARRMRRLRTKSEQNVQSCEQNVQSCEQNVQETEQERTNRYESIEIRDKRLEIRDKSIERESKERNTHPHFMPPTVEEVYLYCEQRHNGIDAQRFVDYYTAKGWKNITDWKAQIRVWESRKEITE